jgi:autotransporter-associated beta strand protein
MSGADTAVFDKNGVANTVTSIRIYAPATDYKNVIIGSGTLTLNGNLNLEDNDNSAGNGFGATVAGGTLNLGGGTRTLNVDGQNLSQDELIIASAITNGGVRINATPSSFNGTAAGVVLTSAGNTYALGTTIASGYLTVASGSSLGTGAVTLTTGSNNSRLVVQGALTVNGLSTGALGAGEARVAIQSGASLTTSHAGDLTYAGVISGNGTFVKAGAGTLTLTGGNTNSGGTTINSGTLFAANASGSATGTDTVTVNSTGTLGGTGTVTGAVTVNSGGTIRGGTATGTGLLTTGNVSVTNGGILAANLGLVNATPTNSDASRLGLGGSTLDLVTGSRLSLAKLAAFDGTAGTYVLATLTNGNTIRLNGVASTDGAVFGTFVSTGGNGGTASGAVTIDLTGFALASGDQLTLQRTGNNLVLNFTPVPEPTMVLGVGVLGLVILRRIGRRWRAGGIK